MKIIECEQGSEEWLKARLGLVTASELDNLITPGWKVKDIESQGPTTYLYRKLAEAWLGRPVNQFGSFAMEQGQLLEPEARPYFELANDCEVSTKAGFIIGDDGRCGCSPDGLIEEKNCIVASGNGLPVFSSGLEIKCPQETNAVRYSIEGVLPADYELQVNGSLYVTGFHRWHFLSYHRSLPKFQTVIERDETKCATIAKALAGFYERFDAEWEKLNSIAYEPKKNPFTK